MFDSGAVASRRKVRAPLSLLASLGGGRRTSDPHAWSLGPRRCWSEPVCAVAQSVTERAQRRAFVRRRACCICGPSRSEPKPQRAGLTRSGLAHHAAPHAREILAWSVPTYTRVRCVLCCAGRALMSRFPWSSVTVERLL